jgi:MFS family permease
VQDNLSIHKPASLYEAFPPAEARRLVERFEWHYTPKHGSSVGVLLSTPAFGMIADRLGYRAVMWLAVGLSVPAILLLWHSDGFTLTLIGRLFQGAASAATWTAGLALIAARYKEQRVQMIGLPLMASTGGSIVGPIMSGVLYQYGGYTLPFVVLCGFALADAALRFLLLPPTGRTSPAVPVWSGSWQTATWPPQPSR